jgi:IstB-like ATP binding protein
VPQRIAYDSLRAAVTKTLVGSERLLAARFEALSSHYLFEACFCRPRTGHDKGGVESRGKAIRWQHLLPIPRGADLGVIRAADVVRTLLEARDARELGRLQRRLYQVELLVLDELGFVPFDRAGGELLFNLLTERYERRSVTVTTNLAFAEWVKVFGGDEKLTTALLDRLAHHATVIATKGKSFKMRKKGLTERTIEDQTTTDALPKAGRKA